MKYNSLGRTGLKVSRICLGTMTLGSSADEKTSRVILDKALDAGVTFFDAADIYPAPPNPEWSGRTEEIIGRWLPGKRDRVVVTSKFQGVMGSGPNDRGSSRAHILDAIDATLRRLQTDYVDVYLAHWPDAETPIEETLRALDDLVRWGKVRYAGCCNFEGWRLVKSLWTSDRLRLTRFEAAQNRYNLLYRRIEGELLPACREEGVGVMAYNPLASGFLTGKYTREQAPSGDVRFAQPGIVGERSRILYWHEENFEILARLQDIAAGMGVTAAQLAIAWALHRPEVSTAIAGARLPEQLDGTLPAGDLDLDDATYQVIDALRPSLSREAP